MKKALKWLGIIIVALIVIGAISSLGNKSDSTSPPASNGNNAGSAGPAVVNPEITISAAELAEAYESNEVSADQKYKGKLAEITGSVADIGVVLDQTYIVLSSEKDFSLTDVQCYFKHQAQIDKVANLKKGDKVTVQGKIEGKYLNVTVQNCII